MSSPTAPDYVPAIEPGETLVYLVRHGETEWNKEKRFQGQLDVPLSSAGLEQAEQLARWMATLPVRFSAIYTSDLRRAAETARALGRALSIEPTPVRCLREQHCGIWQGLSVAEVEERYPGELARLYGNIKSFRIPGGESVPDLQARLYACYLDLARKHTGQAIMLVSHGAAFASLIAALNGWDLQEVWDTGRARMGNTALSIVATRADGPSHRTLLVNAFPHLDRPAGMDSVLGPWRGSAV